MSIVNIKLPFGAYNNKPSRIIVHSMGEYISDGRKHRHAVDLLRDQKLSTHILVTPSGTLIRCRDDDQGAYHARSHNTGSLGIEFLVPGLHTYSTFIDAIKRPYLTHEQYKSGVNQVKKWVSSYCITDIKRHSDVDPDRKYDPGEGFPWTEFL